MNYFTDYFLDVIKTKYAFFEGRARRKEFWFFILFYIILSIPFSLIDSLLGTSGILQGLYALVLLLPGIGLSIRRLHDTGRSGWWLLVGLVPLIGAIVLIIFYVQDSKPGSNQYGPCPK